MMYVVKKKFKKEDNPTITLKDVKTSHCFLLISTDSKECILSKKDNEENELIAKNWYDSRKRLGLYAKWLNMKAVKPYTLMYNPQLKKETKTEITQVDIEAIIRTIKRIQDEKLVYDKKDGLLKPIYFAAIYRLLNDGGPWASHRISYRDFEELMRDSGFSNVSATNIQEHDVKIKVDDQYPYCKLGTMTDKKKKQFVSFIKDFLNIYDEEKSKTRTKNRT